MNQKKEKKSTLILKIINNISLIPSSGFEHITKCNPPDKKNKSSVKSFKLYMHLVFLTHPYFTLKPVSANKVYLGKSAKVKLLTYLF